VSIPQLSVRATVVRADGLPDFFAGAAADTDLAWRRRADGGYSLALGSAHDLYLGPDAVRHALAWLPVARTAFHKTRFRAAAPRGFPDAWGTKRRWSGTSPFEAMRVLDPPPNLAMVAAIRRLFTARFPSFPAPELTHAWAGMIDSMPDVVPVVDAVETLSGLVVATGMSGHGFGIGPGFGRIVADLVAGRPAGHDLRRFRFARFSDGSPLEIGPSL